MPRDAPPSAIINACRVRRNKQRMDTINLAMAVSNLVLSGFSDKPDPLKAIRHLFTEQEFEDMMEEREEREQMAIQAQQIAMLRRLG